MKITGMGLLALLLLAPSVGLAADASPAEIAFWESVANSKSADELNLYLQNYPNGAYAALARLKINALGGAPAPAAAATNAEAAAAPAASAPAAAHEISSAVITATPAAIHVGDQVSIAFANLPKPSPFDRLVVVNAGAPDTTGTNDTSDGVLASNFMSNSYVTNGTFKLGPFAPGKYEIRWLSTLYNNNTKLETVARTRFEVDP